MASERTPSAGASSTSTGTGKGKGKGTEATPDDTSGSGPTTLQFAKLRSNWYEMENSMRVRLAKITIGLRDKFPDAKTGPGFKFNKDTVAPRTTPANLSNKTPWVALEPADTLEAARYIHLQQPNWKILVLNHADDKKPGGKFLEGSTTQEESLLIRSTLWYSIVPERKLAEAGKTLYPILPGECIYSKDVMVLATAPLAPLPAHLRYHVDVISCPATRLAFQPTDGEGKWYYKDDKEKELVAEKFAMILRVACEQGVQAVVLGALGCGVFRHPPHEVARILREVLTNREKYEDWKTNGIEFVCIAVKDMTADSSVWQAFTAAFENANGVAIDWEGKFWLKGL